AANFNAPLFGANGDPTGALKYWADNAVQLYLAGGAPAAKLTMGVPFYGHGWKGVQPGANNDGLFQSGTGAATGTYEAGTEDYKVLKTLEATFSKFRHAEAQTFWIYNPSTKIFWSYDDPSSVSNKMSYIQAKGLGGAM